MNFQQFLCEAKKILIQGVKGVIYAWSFAEMMMTNYHVNEKIRCVFNVPIDIFHLLFNTKGKRELQPHDLEFLRNGKVVKTAFLNDYLEKFEEITDKNIKYDCVVLTKNNINKYVQWNPRDINVESMELNNPFIYNEMSIETIRNGKKDIDEEYINFKTDEYNYIFEKNIFCHSFLVYFMKKHYKINISENKYVLTCFKNHSLKKICISRDDYLILGEE